MKNLNTNALENLKAGSGKPCTHRYYEPPQGAERSEQSDLG